MSPDFNANEPAPSTLTIKVVSERTDSKTWYYVTINGEKVSQHSFKWTAMFKAWRLKALLPRIR